MRPSPGARRAIFVACALALGVARSQAAGPAAHTVTIDAFEFHPPSITVRQGDTVEWRNQDPVPHTATAKVAGLDSRDIAPNGSFRYTAKKKGRFGYICSLHPVMKGELIVE